MFYGEYEHRLENKGRIIIPAQFRQVLAEYYTETIYLTRGLDNCIFVFTEDEWKTQESKFKNLSFTKSEARQFNRLFFSGATQTVCDKQGRILIPKYLKDYAGIKKDITTIGVSNRIEIWDKDTWKEFYKSRKGSFEEIAEKLLEPQIPVERMRKLRALNKEPEAFGLNSYFIKRTIAQSVSILTRGYDVHKKP